MDATDLVDLLAKHEPAEVLEIIRVRQRAWFTRLIEAWLRDDAEWRDAGLEAGENEEASLRGEN